MDTTNNPLLIRSRSPAEFGRALAARRRDQPVYFDDNLRSWVILDQQAIQTARCDIHRVAHQVLLNVHRRLFVRCNLPTVPETLRDFDERGEKLAEMLGIQRVRGHAPLSFPILAFHRKNARDTHLLQHRLDRAQATIQLRTIAQDGLVEFRIGDDVHRPLVHFEFIERAELITPSFENAMELFQVSCSRLPTSGSPLGPGKVGQGSHGRIMAGNSGLLDSVKGIVIEILLR